MAIIQAFYLSQQGVQIAARRDGSRQISTPTLPNEEQGELGRLFHYHCFIILVVPGVGPNMGLQQLIPNTVDRIMGPRR